ncbi:unnamed protein product [Ambrosiozyma monospora]|uniref:Unnamed protein product n=1 Tax=Ambrosiozyma monospora TaxID=43982 RepID=A0A9W6YTI8_AMBMO|nr:unnamed protein product [Ambrosiozyma monospora]
MASAIYILDNDLNLLIQRQYKYDLNSSFIVDNFQKAYKKNQSTNSNNDNVTSAALNTPILTINEMVFVFIRVDFVIFMSPVFDDVNVMGLVSFLSKFAQLLKNYFIDYKLIDRVTGKLSKELIKDNYILIYELFDETLDFGIPQLTDFNILREYIKLIVSENEVDQQVYNSAGNMAADKVKETVANDINTSISRTSTTKISWRPKGIFYSKNEFFINMVEHIRFKYNMDQAKVVYNTISGELDCKCFLSGMPTLTLSVNEDILDEHSIFSNINFHQSVQLTEPEEPKEDEKEIDEEDEAEEGGGEDDESHTGEYGTKGDTASIAGSRTSIVGSYPDPDDAASINTTTTTSSIAASSIAKSVSVPSTPKIPAVKKYQTNKSLRSSVVKFVPPDGDFKLATYQITNTTVLRPLVLVIPSYKLFYKHDSYKLKIKVKLTSNFPKKSKNQMKDLKITIPIIIPNKHLCLNFVSSSGGSGGLKFKTKMGTVVHELNKNCIVWQIAQIDGNSKAEMVSEFDLISTTQLALQHDINFEYGKQDKNDIVYYDLNEDLNLDRLMKTQIRVLMVEFKLNITYSDLKINYLKIEEPMLKFQTFPWIKYNTYCKGDDYCFVIGNKHLKVELSDEKLKELDDEHERYEREREAEEAELDLADLESKIDSLVSNDDGEPVPGLSASASMNGDISMDSTSQQAGKSFGKYKYGDRFIDFEEYVLEDEPVGGKADADIPEENDDDDYDGDGSDDEQLPRESHETEAGASSTHEYEVLTQQHDPETTETSSNIVLDEVSAPAHYDTITDGSLPTADTGANPESEPNSDTVTGLDFVDPRPTETSEIETEVEIKGGDDVAEEGGASDGKIKI